MRGLDRCQVREAGAPWQGPLRWAGRRARGLGYGGLSKDVQQDTGTGYTMDWTTGGTGLGDWASVVLVFETYVYVPPASDYWPMFEGGFLRL